MRNWILSLTVFVHVLYINAVRFFPYPELFIYPYLTSKGFLPYRDILDQHFPAFLMLPVNLWNLGFQGEWQMRILMSVTLVLTHVFIHLISKKILGKTIVNILPNLFYLASQPLYDGSYFWIDNMLAPLSLSVLYVLISRKNDLKNYILAGLILGVAICAKQTMVLFALALIFITFFKRRNVLESFVFIFATATPVFVLIGWIYSRNIFNEFLFWAVHFNYTVYPKMASQMPTFSQTLRFLVLWGATGYLYGQKKKKTYEHHLLGISALALTIPAFGRFEFLHLQTALPFVILLFSLVFYQSSFILPEFLKKRRVDPGILVFGMIIFLCIWHFSWFYSMQGGSYLSEGDTPKIAEEIKRRISKNDHIFILGGNPVLYPMTNSIPSGDIYTVAVPWNYRVSESKIVEGLEEDRPKLVVVDENTYINGVGEEDFAKEVLKFIDYNYEREETINGYVFYKQK